MIDPVSEFKKWVITTLGTATGLPVYDGINPNPEVNTYIDITSRSSSQLQGKTDFIYNVTLTVDCVTRGNFTGSKQVDAIGLQVTTAINSNTAIVLGQGKATSLYLQGSINLDGINSTDNVFRKIITYNVIIS